jgi:hypothetical protein
LPFVRQRRVSVQKATFMCPKIEAIRFPDMTASLIPLGGTAAPTPQLAEYDIIMI